MKKGVLKTVVSIVLAAMVVCGLSISAYAMSGEAAGSALLFTYYDLRSDAAGGLDLTDNYFTVTNTSSHWVQAHVRIRTGETSIELLDFDILLSPEDAFAFDLYEKANGAVEFASCDTKTLINSGFTPNYNRDGRADTGLSGNECFVLDSNTFLDTSGNKAMLSLIKKCRDITDDTVALEKTKRGYVEVIGEGIVYACSSDKNKCNSHCSDPGSVSINATDPLKAKLLLHSDSTRSLVGKCPTDVAPMQGNELIGRVYYGTVESSIIMRLAQLNGEILDDGNLRYSAPILHYEDAETEALASKCGNPDGSVIGTFGTQYCYAYVDATKGDTVAKGADDLNNCFYKAKIDADNDVANKFGAAGTFGPTIIDIADGTMRNGTLVNAASALSTIIAAMGDGYTTSGGGFHNSVDIEKELAFSHYVSFPSTFLDVNTAFVFIFPLQHYIDEKDKIGGPIFWNMEEDQKTYVPGKFLSPGLPSVSEPSPEVYFTKFTTPPYNEGWLLFDLSGAATNATTGCDESDSNTNSCEVKGGGPYTPGYTGAAFLFGSHALSASHLQYGESTD